MSVLLVASDRPGAGKSAVALALAAISNGDGHPVAAFQPFSPDPDGEGPAAFARLATNPVLDGWPRLLEEDGPSSGAVEALGAALDGVEAAVKILEVPSEVGLTALANLSEALDASALVVARCRRDLRGSGLARWRDALGDRLAGALVNGVTRFLGNESAAKIAPSFADAGIELFGMIPEDRFMLSVTVDQARDRLGGRYAVEEGDTNGALERFQVGGMSLDPGELRFGLYDRNAVVVRGDRPDIQMSALNASVACMVLTGGIDPIEYISYEAREEETPVIVVEPDTLTVMSLLNDVTAAARIDTAGKVARFRELLEANADLDRIRTIL